MCIEEAFGKQGGGLCSIQLTGHPVTFARIHGCANWAYIQLRVFFGTESLMWLQRTQAILCSVSEPAGPLHPGSHDRCYVYSVVTWVREISELGKGTSVKCKRLHNPKFQQILLLGQRLSLPYIHRFVYYHASEEKKVGPKGSGDLLLC